jgi:hypothetical protein
MNSLFHCQESKLVYRGSAKGLEMSHNGAISSTRFPVERRRCSCSQVLARILVQKSNRLTNDPKLLVGPVAFDPPIVTAVTVAIAGSVRRNLLLIRKRTRVIVAVQIFEGIRVGQPNQGTARNGHGLLARRCICYIICCTTRNVTILYHGVFLVGIIMCGTDPPECIVRAGNVDKRDNLLPAATAELFGFRIQLETRYLV